MHFYSFKLFIFISTVHTMNVLGDLGDETLSDEAIESNLVLIAPEEVHSIESSRNLKQKEYRVLEFLNNLNNLGGIITGGGNGIGNNRDTESSTQRLAGRPGFGFIPDIQKGVSTILGGVATGNLEKILEGSFVFAPNRVQQVAGTVLDSVFAGNRNPGSGSGGTAGSRPASSGVAGVRPSAGVAGPRPSAGVAGPRPTAGVAGPRPGFSQGNNNNRNNLVVTSPSSLTPTESNQQLWEIIKLQQQQIHRQKQVIEDQIKAISTQPKSSPSNTNNTY